MLIFKQIDKLNHAAVGYLLFCILAPLLASPLAPLAIVAIVGAGKELFDMVKKNTRVFDYMDFIYTIAGAVPAFILTLLK